MFDQFAKVEKVFMCAHCGRVHLARENTYMLIAGNIMIGMDGGLIGNVFDNVVRLEAVAVWCRTEECFGKHMLDYLREAALGHALEEEVNKLFSDESHIAYWGVIEKKPVDG